MGGRSTVDGSAWFDHQWGDFISVGGGGWDWFAVNLDDGTDLTLSLVRDADGSYPLIYGTVVARNGRVAAPRSGRVPGRGDRPLGEPDDRRRLPRRLDDPDPRRGSVDHTQADGRGAGTRHPRDDRGHLLGGLAGGPRDPGRDAARWPGLRGADRVRGDGDCGRAEAPRRQSDVRNAATAVTSQPATIVSA